MSQGTQSFYCRWEHHLSIVGVSGNTIFLFIVSGNTNFLFIVSGITHLSVSGNTIFLLSLGSPIFLLSVPPIFLEFYCLWGPSIVSGNIIFLLSPGTPSFYCGAFYCLWEHHLSFYYLWDHPSFCLWEHHLFTASGNTIVLLSLGSPSFLLSLGSCSFLLSLGSRSFPAGRVLRQVSHDTWTSVATSQSYQDECYD